MSLGDLAINAPESYCENYLIDTIKILFDAGELSLKKAEYKDDQDALVLNSCLKLIVNS